MNAKDKAKELVEKFKNRSIELGNTHFRTQLMAEANALIAVDEILNAFYSLRFGNALDDELEYWEEVKREIEKL